MEQSMKELCDRIVASSLQPRRISKSSIYTRPLTKKDTVVPAAAEELLGQFAQMYLIPPEDKIEVSDENTIETSTEELYDKENELAGVGVVR